MGRARARKGEKGTAHAQARSECQCTCGRPDAHNLNMSGDGRGEKPIHFYDRWGVENGGEDGEHTIHIDVLLYTGIDRYIYPCCTGNRDRCVLFAFYTEHFFRNDVVVLSIVFKHPGEC